MSPYTNPYNHNSSIPPSTHSLIHSFIHQPMQSCTHTFMFLTIYSCTNLYMHSRMHSFTHPCMHSRMHSFTHPCMHPYMHACTLPSTRFLLVVVGGYEDDGQSSEGTSHYKQHPQHDALHGGVVALKMNLSFNCQKNIQI